MDKNSQYAAILKSQIESIKKENRFLEFKSNYQEAERLGKYISALANGACLDNKEFGYLYFGIEDETLLIKGTTFDALRTKAKGNQDLELYLRQNITPKNNFQIEEFEADGKRIVVFIIPSAKEEPVCFFGIPYVRVDSSVTDMRPYSDWMRQIYNSHKDWTAEIVPEGTISDLDEKAINIARKGFAERFPDLSETMQTWNNETFLDKAKLTINGQITRTALLLVGKEESSYLLGGMRQIVWKLVTEQERAGEVFGIPFILATSKVKDKIRNYRMKIFPNNSLFPAEIWKYDTKTILEGMHNCVAHQDYSLGERIIVTEENDKLTFQNSGNFYDGEVEDYINGEKTPKNYRNPFLVQAMLNLKMIDTQGNGIHSMFVRQKERYLPMPEYDKRVVDKVILTIPGKVISQEYSELLMERNDIDLTTAVLLDKVQKNEPITDEAATLLRRKKLIEGRKPNYYIAKFIATAMNQQVDYSQKKGFTDEQCMALIINALKDHKKLTKSQVRELLSPLLSKSLTDDKITNKIDNILRNLRAATVVYYDKDKKVWCIKET